MVNPYMSPGGVVPPPGAYHQQQPIYFSPYYYNPSQMSAMNPGVETSPSKFQQDEAGSFTQPTFGSLSVPFAPLQHQGLFSQPFSAPTGMSFGTSFDGGQFSSVPGQFTMRGTGNREESGVGSPSGVTGSSMQVHAPTSPPSVSMQPVSTGTSGKTEPLAPLLVTSSTGTTVEVTTATGLDKGVVGGATGGVKDSSGVKKESGGKETVEGAESMSSLPMSIPEATR